MASVGLLSDYFNLRIRSRSFLSSSGERFRSGGIADRGSEIWSLGYNAAFNFDLRPSTISLSSTSNFTEPWQRKQNLLSFGSNSASVGSLGLQTCELAEV